MLSLRRQVPPGLCHRATPSLPRTLPSSRALLRCDPVATTLPISRPSGLFPSDFHACSACVGSDHQGLDSAKLRRLRRGGHRPHATPRLASRLPAAPAAAQRVLARPTRDTERTARLGPRLSIVAAVPQRHSRRPQATATSRPATLASARCVLARPVRDTERTSVLDSAELRRLCHRPRAALRPTSRLSAALAVAQRALTRPVWDAERTATSILGTALRLLRHGGHRPRAASHPSHDCRLLLLRPGVCRLGPSGTQSVPPASTLDSAELRRLSHGGHRPRATPRPASQSRLSAAFPQRPAAVPEGHRAHSILRLAHDSTTLSAPPRCFVLACGRRSRRHLVPLPPSATRPPLMRHSYTGCGCSSCAAVTCL